MLFLFFKQKTAYELRISDWSSDVCSSDLSSLSCATAHPTWRFSAMSPRLIELFIDSAVETLTMVGAASLATLLLGLPLGVLLVVTDRELGRASCRERVCQYVYISVASVYLKKQLNNLNLTPTDIIP